MAKIDPNDTIMTDAASAALETIETDQAAHRELEDQLAVIISSARGVAIAAEELLRELAQESTAKRARQHAISMAPRLLAATEQQLNSVAVMLRKS
jgi:hypothetical protein